MKTTIIAAALTAGSVLGPAPAGAYATTGHKVACGAVVHDHFAKTDSGHGNPPEWADLKFARTTTIRCTSPGHYAVKIMDRGSFRTLVGAGRPNGGGGQITNAVRGEMHGAYWLTVTGALAVPSRRDTSLSATAYVTALFDPSSVVKGATYSWAYRTVCGEEWLDSSLDNDGQDPAVAGNITGKTCRPRHTPRPAPTTPTPTPTRNAPSTGGEAPPATPVKRQPAFTG
ncbi:hypothetical protein [Actinomadura sp. DC4]|uniref:hypothetical protein n=1 Tax=Actinomadura sp. DC4 TaxID=3055069 RepID=UPI0025AF5D43|nr:hypothetical protein [Actinomadura sp. DC4]MDN3356101.1 hypothetical protein [Actinomadura sp. DC4]